MMDPVIDNEWLSCKNDQLDETQNVGNITRSWQSRELGIDPNNYPPNKTVLENIAEDILVKKPLKIRCCDLPGYPRSTFLMVFSPDGTKLASTHGNHNVYVSELASGKHVRILKGHPRTPWCIAFHPSHTQLIGSGCLAGQVRVWDISSGGSEVWNVRNETGIASLAFHPREQLLGGSEVWNVRNETGIASLAFHPREQLLGGSEVWNVRNETGIASLAFHPREQLLVIATYNELYFWDWSQPAPFTKVSTNNIHEKVRYVAFDSLGYKLITGISLWTGSGGATGNSVLHHNPVLPQTHVQTLRRAETEDNQDANRSQENSGTAQDMIVDSYHNLVQRYDSLVRNYQRLFMVRHQLNNTPPPPSMIDRGTDPMETDTSSNSQNSHGDGPSASEQQNDDNPTPGPSRRLESHDSSEGDVGSSRLLNLDVLSFGNSRSRNQRSTTPEHSIFGSRSSAFQPLGDSPERRALRDLELNARASRLLPNPFSSSSSTRLSRSPFPNSPMLSSSNTSRTRIFAPTRQRRRSISPPQLNFDGLAAAAPGNDDNSQPRPSTSSPSESQPSTSEATADRSPTAANANHCQVDAQTINESLDLIRDILRDSGTRLLNLITNMSLSTLASVERNVSRRGGASRAQSEEAERGGRARAPRPRLFSSSVRRVFLSSSSDSDSDQSLEVNIFRTRNVTFNENNSDAPSNSAAAGSTIGNSNSHAPSNSNAPSSSTTRSSSTTPSNSNATGSSATGSSAATSSSTGTGSSAATSSSASTSISTATCSSTDPRNSSGPSSSTASQCQSDRPTQSADRMEFELSEESQNDLPRDSNSINVSLSNSRFRVRNHKPPGETGPSDGAGSSNQPEPDADNRPSEPRPSTSRDDFWNSGNVVPPDEAYRKVRGGVNALHKHTVQLTNLWLRGNRVTMRELRTMWDNLRRRILMLHRETGRQDLPSYYTRSLFERCMMLTELSDSVSRTSPRNLRSNQRTENAPRSETQDISVETSNANSNSQGDNDQNDAAENTNSPRPSTSGRASQTRSSILSTPSMRRRIQANYRWRPEDELRRRTRNPNRITPRYCGRPRRDFARAIELSATRHEIRMRAMQVLSVMFNMMMMCLEERGLSLLIINMLRTLKKALALTCLMLMTNRNAVRGSGNIPGPPMNQRSEPLNVVRIQNADHSEPVNVDDPDDNDSNSQPTTASSECKRTQPSSKQSKTAHTSVPSTSQAAVTETRQRASIPQSLASQRWSNRLAVQIAAANRNYSSTARNRRELYIETKRLKVLHRTNPLAYPMMKKRALPPISTHKIPALRFMPTRSKIVRPNARANDTSNNSNQEPVAGPSREAPAENSNEESPRLMNAYEQRVNLIRIAQMHAVRLRNVTRNRFRRLQSIRLYTPSSLRDMYEFQSNNGENPQEGRSPQNESDGVSRRPFVSYRPHILAQRIDRPADDRGQFHAVLNNVAMPLMQVNDMPVNQEGQGGPTQRLPRIHEYLQPIILAQNAMVVDDENGGEGGGGGGVPGPRLRHIAGMAGLLDAGMISDQPPNPHRIQAWDFSAAATPDIADSTKNVVVQKCRIHNDASIDISKDGRLLVALLPVPRLRNANHWLGVYSLEWSRLGQCLHTAALEQSAVSLALSPTGRHLAVGLGSRRFTSAPHARSNVFALLFRLQRPDSASRTGLSPIKELEQNWEHGSTSLNCLRWAPQPGQGLVYANNTGQLIIMS